MIKINKKYIIINCVYFKSVLSVRLQWFSWWTGAPLEKQTWRSHIEKATMRDIVHLQDYTFFHQIISPFFKFCKRLYWCVNLHPNDHSCQLSENHHSCTHSFIHSFIANNVVKLIGGCMLILSVVLELSITLY